MANLISRLFETKAIRVSPENEPFWYTSGLIGPLYVNTHYLYGGESDACALLSRIDELLKDGGGRVSELLPEISRQYEINDIFRETIDELVAVIKSETPSFDYISGGERRDWFFSLMTAKLLRKPHITLFKERKPTLITPEGETCETSTLNGAKVLHIADLVTKASSYERAWVPMIKTLGGEMTDSLVVVDRLQGGAEVLLSMGVKSHSLVRVEPDVFRRAHEIGQITAAQLEMVLSYMENPHESMREFLTVHPEFLENALNSDQKIKARAQLLIERDLYQMENK